MAPIAERIRVIHRGVDPVQFDPAAVDDERVARAARSSWGIAAGTRVISASGAAHRLEGPDASIEAAGLLARTRAA